MPALFLTTWTLTTNPRTGEPRREPVFDRAGVTEWHAVEFRGKAAVAARGINAAPAGTRDLVPWLTTPLSGAAANQVANELGVDRSQVVGRTISQIILESPEITLAPIQGRWYMGLLDFVFIDAPVVAGGATITEPFTYSNGDLNGNGGWTVNGDSADVDISSNAITVATDNKQGFAVNSTQIGSGDHYVQFVGTYPADEYNGGAGLLRCSGVTKDGTWDGYRADIGCWQMDSGPIDLNYEVTRYDNNTGTTVVSATKIVNAPASAETYRYEVEGNNLRIYRSAGLVTTYSSASSYTSNDYVGFYIGRFGSVAPTLDTFEAGPMAAAATSRLIRPRPRAFTFR